MDEPGSRTDQGRSDALLKVGAIASIVVCLALDALGVYLIVKALDGSFDVDQARMGALLLVGGGLVTAPGILLDRRARERLRGIPLDGRRARTIRTIGTVAVVLGVVGMGFGVVLAASKAAGADGVPSWPVVSAQFGLDGLLVAGGLAMRRWVGRA